MGHFAVTGMHMHASSYSLRFTAVHTVAFPRLGKHDIESVYVAQTVQLNTKQTVVKLHYCKYS